MKKKDRQNLIDTFLLKNSHINLSAIRDEDSVYVHHILDSLQFLEHASIAEHETCIDIGTGGGFPLLPLAISFPKSFFTGIDARRKKVHAVEDIANTIGLQNCELTRGRVEEHKKKYDLVTARAVTYATQLFDRSRHVCKKNGRICRWKQFSFEEDADITELGIRHRYAIERYPYVLPGTTTKRIIYKFQKS